MYIHVINKVEVESTILSLRNSINTVHVCFVFDWVFSRTGTAQAIYVSFPDFTFGP